MRSTCTVLTNFATYPGRGKHLSTYEICGDIGSKESAQYHHNHANKCTSRQVSVNALEREDIDIPPS